jgi:hypothetical protein
VSDEYAIEVGGHPRNLPGLPLHQILISRCYPSEGDLIDERNNFTLLELQLGRSAGY